jgi:ubiquinone/menaquinone biosynthesis C-methylase UbiE
MVVGYDIRAGIIDYLDSEDFISRTTEEVERTVATRAKSDDLERLIDLQLKMLRGMINEQEFYDASCMTFGISSYYDLIKSRQRGVVEWVLENILKESDSRTDLDILDVGSATGLEAVYLAQSIGRTGRTLLLDKSKNMLEIARKRAERRNLANCYYITGDRENLPVFDQSVDLVLCIISLISNGEDAIGDYADYMINKRVNEMDRVLRKGGRIVIINNSVYDLEYDKSRFQWIFEGLEYASFKSDSFTEKVDDRTFEYVYVSSKK